MKTKSLFVPIEFVAEMINKRFVTFALAVFSSVVLFAQETIVKGKVTDVNSGDPLPFVNVVFKGTTIGTTTDFDGNYFIKTSTPTDSVFASYIGYKPKHKKIVKGISQTIDFQIEEDIQQLDEVVVRPGVNPAFEILRQVNKHKNINDKRRLTAYEYDTYTKIEIDVDNISDKFREKKLMKKITNVLDSIDRIAGEDGKPILPLLITESVSKIYYRDNPSLKFEHILQSKITGVGVEDGTLVTQLVGSSFQEYNFYQNWLNIVSKEFISPIADGGRLYYEYDLMDSLYVGNDYCYRLDFYPRSPQDLAFTGTMWITKDGYALRQIDAAIGKQANINFVEKIKIQQELAPTEKDGAWLPTKNRVLIDLSEVNNGQAGMLAKFYTSNKKFVINKPYEVSFYQQPILMAEDARLNESEAYWDTLRHEPLSSTEKNVYKMIDTLQTIPVVRTYTDIIKIMIGGYYSKGKIDIGPYVSLLAANNIEGVRIQPGFKTNIKFSNKWVLGGQLGYGFKDQKFKYLAYVQNIISREKWTTLTVSARSDLSRVGLADGNADNFLLQASQRFGVFRRGYYFDQGKVEFKRELFKGFSQSAAFRYSTFAPTYNFGYYEQPDNAGGGDTLQNYRTSEFIFESRYARDELFVQDDNDRVSLGTTRWPVITFRYVKGVKGILGSDFDYQKFRLSLYKRIRTGPFGIGYLHLEGDYVQGTLPYPLLTLHLGNQTILYSSSLYNLMRYGEFISDRSVALQYQHHFEGLLLNRIPLMRKLKWRLTASANVVYGSLSQDNLNINAEYTADGQETLPVGTFKTGLPYVELGYGVENIFKFIRVEFVHRMTYLDNVIDGVTPKKFGVRIGFQFSL